MKRDCARSVVWTAAVRQSSQERFLPNSVKDSDPSGLQENSVSSAPSDTVAKTPANAQTAAAAVTGTSAEERATKRAAAKAASGKKAEEKKKLNIKKAWREARRLMWHHRKRLAIGFSLMIVSRLAGLILPGSSKVLLDEVIGKSRVELLVPLGLAVAAATLVEAVTKFSLSQIISVAAQEAIMDMRMRVQEHVTRLPVRFFDDTKTGVLISRIMSDAEGIRNLVGTGIIQLVGGLFSAVLALSVLLYLNWQLTAITIVVLALFGAVMTYAFNKLRPIFRERTIINSEVTGRLNETLNGIRIIKAYNVEQREQQVFATGIGRLFDNIKSSITGVSLVTSFGTLIVGIVGVIMLLIGGNAIVNETMTIGDFVMYVFFTGMLAAPVIQMASIGTQVSDALAGLERISDLLSEGTEDELDESRQRVGDVDGNVTFEDVSFHYDEDVPVLKNISFTARAGTTTALVGSSGSGKSTLVGLVMAFYRPQSGRVLIDGRDLADVRVQEYRQILGVVLQENFLFDGTVAENIRFTNPTATQEEIENAARIANCHDFIQSFPEQYESIVGERGIKLSGGQRQRIAIARALLANPQILVLDEATSSLDTESETMIQQGLDRLKEGRTAFVIAHRLSTIRSADQILVLEEGEIVEQGTHAELMELNGRYRELHDLQHAWEDNRFVNPGEEIAGRPTPEVSD